MGTQMLCFANVTSNCSLSQVGTPSLGSGRWASGPVGQITPTTPPSSINMFEASEKEGSTGIDGQTAYSGPDGTVFSFVFNVPYSGANGCTLSVTSGTAANYTYSSTYNQGEVCNFDSIITYLAGQVNYNGGQS